MVRSLSYGSMQIINIPLIVLSLYVYINCQTAERRCFCSYLLLAVAVCTYWCITCKNLVWIRNFALERNFKLLNLTTQKHTGNTLVISFPRYTSCKGQGSVITTFTLIYRCCTTSQLVRLLDSHPVVNKLKGQETEILLLFE